MPYSPATLPLPLHPIAAALLAAFCLVPAEAPAVQVVTNCNDKGPGSLRQAVHDAASGELVDATTLVCSKITLTTGYILVGQTLLKIDGPGADKLTVTTAAGSQTKSRSSSGWKSHTLTVRRSTDRVSLW